MTLYELMLKTNHHLICETKPYLTDAQKAYITGRFLDGISSQEECLRFYRGVRFPDNRDCTGRRMYPEYFIPPYNDGKKYKSVLGQTPTTHIFSANLYELEIIRLLALFSAGDRDVDRIVSHTLARLKTTCFGWGDDGVGECFDTSLVVLRFLAAAAPHEDAWIASRISNYLRHKDDKKRPPQTEWYFRLCLTELPASIAVPHLTVQKQALTSLQAQKVNLSISSDPAYQPIGSVILRRCLDRLPQ